MSLNVLVLGGVGFIGRHLVSYLVKNNLVASVRVADKVLPATAYLPEGIKSVFEDSRLEFKQANLVNPSKFILTEAAVQKVYEREDGKQFDIVFNLAAETKYGQDEQVYEEKVYMLSMAVAKEAAKRGIKTFVEVSTAQVYDAGKKASTEDSKLKPWTAIAKAKLKAEEDLKKLNGLNLIIVRPAIVYGPCDNLGITPRLIIGAVYKQLNEKMNFLWTKDLKINTIHVRDVARALWFVAASKEHKGGRSGPLSELEIYNMVDKADSDQGSVNQFIENIFGIETGFQGTMISQFAKLNMDSITEDVNDKHLQPWAELCKSGGVANTPLTPYLDKELLKDNGLSVDGSKLESMGFKLEHPVMTTELLKEVIDEFLAVKIWPNNST